MSSELIWGGGVYVCVHIYVHILKCIYVEKERNSREGVEIEHLQEELRFPCAPLFFFFLSQFEIVLKERGFLKAFQEILSDTHFHHYVFKQPCLHCKHK